jgi:hypothetical protein
MLLSLGNWLSGRKRGERESKICYEIADSNGFELIVRMMHLEIFPAKPDHHQSLRDAP